MDLVGMLDSLSLNTSIFPTRDHYQEVLYNLRVELESPKN